MVLYAETWEVKIYAPPREHGPAHVHVIDRRGRAEVKISLIDLKVMGRTSFSFRTVDRIIDLVWANHDYLLECWEKLHGKE